MRALRHRTVVGRRGCEKAGTPRVPTVDLLEDGRRHQRCDDGHSDKPAAVDEYGIQHLTADVVGIIDAVGEKTAVVVGHDWGAIAAWHCLPCTLAASPLSWR
jgi:hypothetical protein